MNIFSLLKQQHSEVKDILGELSQMDEKHGQERKQLLAQLEEKLLPHMLAEEEYFYQILLDEAHEKAKAYESIEEHKAARKVLQDLHSVSLDEPEWTGNARVLKELIEHHIEEEEEKIFPLAETVIDTQRAEAVGDRFLQIEQQQPTSL